MIRRVAAIVALLAGAVVAAGCGVADSGNAQGITPGLGLDDTAPTTSTSTTTTTIATESTLTTLPATTSTSPVETENVQLWFISGTRLNPVTISLTSPATLDQVLSALQRGLEDLPPAASLRSAVPAAPRLSVTDNGNGTATVDLPADFFANIPGDDQRRAIGQIVLTLTVRPGIGGVKFTSGGEDAAVVLGNGEQSGRGAPVTRADYRVLTGDVAATTSTTASTTTIAVASADTTVVPG